MLTFEHNAYVNRLNNKIQSLEAFFMKQLSDVSRLPASTIHEVGYYLDSNENFVVTWIGSNQRIIVLSGAFRRITGIQRIVVAGRFESTVETLQELGFVIHQRQTIMNVLAAKYQRTQDVAVFNELYGMSAAVLRAMADRMVSRYPRLDIMDANAAADDAFLDAVRQYRPDAEVPFEAFMRFVVGRRIYKRMMAANEAVDVA